jgi:hypothetical protein
VPLISSAAVACGTLSLCFRLAPIFSNDLERSLSIAAVCNCLFSPQSPHHQEDLLLQFHALASAEDPELLMALCKLRDRSSDCQGCDVILRLDLVLKLAECTAPCSTKSLYRRMMAAFEVASPLPAESHSQLCRRVCNLVSTLLPSTQTAADSKELFSTKAYAVLKCISDFPRHSPFLSYFLNDPLFIQAVFNLAQSLPLENVPGDSNLCVLFMKRVVHFLNSAFLC